MVFYWNTVDLDAWAVTPQYRLHYTLDVYYIDGLSVTSLAELVFNITSFKPFSLFYTSVCVYAE